MNDEPVTVRAVAEWVDGTVDGDGEVTVRGLAPLDSAVGDQLSFADGKHLAKLADTQAGAVLVPAEADISDASLPLIRVDNVERAVAAALGRWAPPEQRPPMGIAPSAVVDPTAKLGADVAIGPNVVVGAGAVIGNGVALCANATIGREVTIGEGTVVAEGAVINARCEIGRRVRIGPNSVVGSEGFGYYLAGGEHHRVPHAGKVVIADDVDLGACVCVDRAKFGATRIGRGTKVDNLVQIAHNVEIGEHCILVGQCGIAGSTTIGDYVVIGGSTGVRDNIAIGDKVVITAYSAVASDLPGDRAYGGIPARPLSIMRRYWMSQTKLPELLKRVKKLEAALDKLNESSADN